MPSIECSVLRYTAVRISWCFFKCLRLNVAAPSMLGLDVTKCQAPKCHKVLRTSWHKVHLKAPWFNRHTDPQIQIAFDVPNVLRQQTARQQGSFHLPTVREPLAASVFSSFATSFTGAHNYALKLGTTHSHQGCFYSRGLINTLHLRHCSSGLLSLCSSLHFGQLDLNCRQHGAVNQPA